MERHPKRHRVQLPAVPGRSLQLTQSPGIAPTFPSSDDGGDSSISDSSIHEAGPDVYDAATDLGDGAPDGEGQDGGHVADAAGDVAPDVQSE